MHGNACYIILNDVMQTVMCAGNCSSISLWQQHPWHLCMQNAHRLYRHQQMKMPQLQLWNEPWRLSCNMAQELGLPQLRVVEGLCNCQLHPYHYSNSTHVSRWSTSTNATLWLAMTSRSYTWALFKNIVWTHKECLCVRLCSTPTTVISGHEIILMLTTDVGIKSTSTSTFGMATLGTLSWAPICHLTGQML
jgi:hypothetical protein